MAITGNNAKTKIIILRIVPAHCNRVFNNNEIGQPEDKIRSNKMAITGNTAKTKFIVFRTRGQRIVPADSNRVFNNNEIGQPEDPNLIYL
jgi:hypothetical protein